MKNPILMVDINGYNKSLAQEETLRFCTGLAYRTRPSDTPPNTLYRPLVRDPGWWRVDVFDRPGRYGHVTPGEIVLDDSSGTLGAQLINYAFDGRSLVTRIGERGATFPYDFVTLLNGTMAGAPSFDWGRITFRPADITEALRRPWQTVFFAGSNALPNGLEGVDDIKGRPKPIVLALASNFSPPCVNTSKLIYQCTIGLGLTCALSAVRSRGVPITSGGTYANLTELQDDGLAPAAGQYKRYESASDGTFFRLGSRPDGQVTCDLSYGAATDRTHGVAWYAAGLYAGLATSEISVDDAIALYAALPGEIELAISEETTAYDLMRRIADSAGATWYGDTLGVHRVAQWTAPSGSPVATLNELRTLDADITDPIGTGDVAPVYRVRVKYGRNWTVQQDADLGGDKTSPTDPVAAPGGRTGLAAREWLAREWREVIAEDTAVKAAHPSAIELTLESMLQSQSAAQSCADAQLALYQVARHMMTMQQWLAEDDLPLVRPGAVVTAVSSRWGYQNGKLMRVAGIEVDQLARLAQISVWG